MESKEALLKKAEKLHKELLAWIDERFKLMEETLKLNEEEAKLSAKKKAKKS